MMLGPVLFLVLLYPCHRYSQSCSNELTTLTEELEKMSKRSSLLTPGKFLVLDIHDVALILIDQRHLVNKKRPLVSSTFFASGGGTVVEYSTHNHRI